MKFTTWIKQQLDYLDAIQHEMKSLDIYSDCGLILHEARQLAIGERLPAAVAACTTSDGLASPDATRVALTECLAACQKSSKTDEMVGIAEAARILGRSESGVRKLVRRKSIRFSQQRKHSAIRFRREWLQEHIDENIVEAPTTATRQRRSRAKINPGGYGFDTGL